MARSILYIGNKLSKHGNTPTSVESLGELLALEYKIISVSDKKNKLLRLSDMLYSIIKYRSQISLVLIDTYSTSNFYYAFLCSYLARILKIKYIPILHGGNLPQRLINNPAMSKSIFSNSIFNIAPSGYLYKAFSEYGYATEFIPNNIDISEYNFSQRKNVRLKLLYVRAISKVYNPSLALEVIEQLYKKYPEVELCMVGPDRDGTLLQLKERVQSLGLQKHVSFLGKLDKKDWLTLSKEYDIFINTTNVDNTPVSIIEAMALGLPIVSTNVGGLPFLIEDTKDGLLVDPNNSAQMVEKITYIYNNPGVAEQLSLHGRQKAESFDWNRISSTWKRSLDNVL